jgi:tetratricopeptide (TPR) repeat protein
LAAQGRYDEAVEAYKKVLAIESQHAWGLPNMAFIMLAAGRAEEAVPYFQQLVELVKQGTREGFYPLTCFNLAVSLRASGKIEDAKRVAEDGLSDLLENVKKPWQAAWIPLMVAKLKILSGKAEGIDDYVRQAESLGINDLGAQVYMAEIYALTGKSSEAIETLKKVIESGHQDPYFLQIFPAFYSLQTKPNFQAIFHSE